MAVDMIFEPPSVETLETALRKLLQRATEIKLLDTVNPALSASDIGREVFLVIEEVLAQVPEDQRQVVFETAARKIYYGLVSSTDVGEPAFVHVWNLLDITIVFTEVETKKLSLILPWYLIEELVESQTTDRCRIVFDYLESRRERLCQRNFANSNPVILRTCNELLRRLSRAEDAAFCGRVFFYLFQVFALGDHSSANLRGAFHVDNVTTFEKELERLPLADSNEAMDIERPVAASATEGQQRDGAQEGQNLQDVTATPHTADHEDNRLYSVFWRLQQDFSVPTRLFEDDAFAIFKEGLETTLAKFEKSTTVVETKSIGEEPRGTKRKLGQESKTLYDDTYNPKYLTSRELFELELSDISFQRHILVQTLIIIDFLLSLSEAAKKKVDLDNIPKPNKSVVYQYTLSEERQEWLTSFRNRVGGLLQRLGAGSEGKFYYRMVNMVLSRDKNWIRWKLESCPPIFREVMSADYFLESKRNARQATATRRIRPKPMGAMDLTFLSEADSAKGLDSLRDRKKFATPTIHELLRGIETDELDMEMATDEERQVLQTRKDNKSWRALRAASRRCLGKLDKVEASKSLQDTFREQESNGVATGDDGMEGTAADGKTSEVQLP